MIPESEVFTNKLFLNAVLPLLKVVAADVPELSAKFAKLSGVAQIAALDPDAPGGKVATHFVIESGAWTVVADQVHPAPDVELEFKSIPAMNAFFKGKIALSTLPRMRGVVARLPLFAAFMRTLLKMSSLLTVKQAPRDRDTQRLVVKCFFYLLTAGISQLNKLGHPEVARWTATSPDRVYALDVEGHPEVAAHLRVKAGKSRSGRGVYTRALPFFTLRFDSFASALGILLATDDMLEATKARRLIMDGAPEFGAQFGGFLLTVGHYVQ
ncbi:MAG: hypothetical protein LBD70_00575 [Bifidobacteriaceae bacterium]|jgi:hypothetical protein|nr:hypothetical protein [Bifidobacteriaceae bacterium]